MTSGLVDAVIGFEGRGDVAGALRFLLDQGLHPKELEVLARSLLTRGRYLSAYGLADRLIASGRDSVSSRLVRGMVARIADQDAQYAADLAALKAADRPDQAELDLIWSSNCHAVALLTQLSAGRYDSVIKIGALLRAVDERLAPLYDSTPSPPAPEPLSRLPPVAATMGPVRALGPRRVVVAARKYFFPSHPNSRQHEIGPRMVAAMCASGWEAAFFPLQDPNRPDLLTDDYRQLLDFCRNHDAEAVVIDQPGLATPQIRDLLAAVAQGGARRVVGLFMDPWVREQWPNMLEVADFLDVAWSSFPALEVWSDPAFVGKTYFAPFPIGIDRPPVTVTTGTANFIGGVQFYNWQRAVWLAFIKVFNLPVQLRISQHMDDDLSAVDSFALYLTDLADAGAALNFAMRGDFSRTMTGRMFEILYSGALLIQEECGDADQFLAAGIHYLPFRTLGDLTRALALIRTEPERIEAIRRAGSEFYRDTYSDRRIISTLDGLLFRYPTTPSLTPGAGLPFLSPTNDPEGAFS